MTKEQLESEMGPKAESTAQVEKSRRDVEQARTQPTPRYRKTRSPKKIGTETSTLVTWILVLYKVHRQYSSYWPGECTLCEVPSTAIGKSSNRTVDTASRDAKPSEGGELANFARSDPAVVYCRWNWDFMPPDMTRPLAETTLGDIVILGSRMGLSWRTLDPENSKLQADGCGYAMNSTEVRGIGTVLRFFTTAGYYGEAPQLVPSVASDKLICGIIPGCPKFVQQDFHLVNNDQKIVSIEDDEGIFAQIGVPKERRQEWAGPRWWDTQNELIILLCPFLPLKGSTIAGFHFPGTVGRSDVRCLFRFWEARVVLKYTIKKRIEALRGSPHVHMIEKASEWLDTWERDYPKDFYTRYQEGAVILNGTLEEKKSELQKRAELLKNPDLLKDATLQKKAGLQRKADLLHSCRTAYDWTTETLENFRSTDPARKLDFSALDENGQTYYIHLVAAHTSMTITAISEAARRQEQERKDGVDHSQAALKRRWNAAFHLEEKSGPGVDRPAMETSQEYIRCINDHHRGGIGWFMRNKGVDISDEEAEAAWWVLTLRGFAWALATRQVDKNRYGEFVPSSFYGNKTPVWIT